MPLPYYTGRRKTKRQERKVSVVDVRGGDNFLDLEKWLPSTLYI
jgi:hypothetical protein